MLLLAALLLGGAAAVPVQPPAVDAPTIVVVVRHAEKADGDPRDPGLSDAGARRAASLAEALASAGVSAVWTSQFRRTRETAQPLAETVGIPVRVLEVRTPDAQQYADALARRIMDEHAGQTVLVVGHSNTVPALVRRLSGLEAGPVAEDAHDDLFIVHAYAGRSALLRVRY